MYFTENQRVREVYSTAGDGSGYKPGNKTVHATRLPRTEELRLLVQNFVRQKRQNRERVTGKQVVDHLIESGRLIVPFEAAVGIDEAIVGRVYRKQQYEAAYRNVRRYLASLGYERGRRTGNIVQKESVLLARDAYLNAFVANRELPPEERRP